MNSIQGLKNNITNISSDGVSSLATGKGLAKEIQKLKKTETVGDSLAKATTQHQNEKKNRKTFTEQIPDFVKKGTEYLREVKDQAIKDRAAGIGIREGADKYWNNLLKEAEKFGRASQNQILDHFANETGSILKDTLKDTSIGKFADSLLSKVSTSKTASVSSTAAAAKTGAGAIGKVAGAAGAAYSLYQLIDGFGKDSPVASAANGATVGAYIGTAIAPGIGTAVGGLIGGIGGAVAGIFGKKKKHPEHAARDQMRDLLVQTNFLDRNQSIKLADGSSFSLAIDGKKKLENMDGGSRFGYQFDASNPLSGAAIGMLQPLAEVLTGGNEKLKTDLTGYLVNAVTSNANNLSDLRENVIAIYEQSGAQLEDIAEMVTEMAERGLIPSDHHEAYIGGIMSVADEDVLFAISGNGVQNEATIH